jgi:MFS family permease
MIGVATSFGSMAEFYATGYLSNYTASQINWIGSIQVFIQFALGLLSGKLLDTGRFRLLAASGTLLFLFSIFMLSLAQRQQYYQVLLSQSVCMGLGLGLLFMPSAGIVANHFTKRRALAMGITTTGPSLGGFFFSIMFSHFFNGKVGFANGVRIGGYICLGCLILANMLMHQYPANAAPISSTSDVHKATRPVLPLLRLIQKPSYTLTVLSGFAFNLGLFFPIFNVQLFAKEETNASIGLVGWLLGIMNLSSSVGRVIPNMFGDRYGPVQISIPCAIISGVLAILMFVCTNSASIVAFCVLYGFFSGGVYALFFPAVLCWDPDMKTSGLRLGVACVPAGIASLVGAPVAAALAQVGDSHAWYAGCIFAGSMEIIAAGLLFAALILDKR